MTYIEAHDAAIHFMNSGASMKELETYLEENIGEDMLERILSAILVEEDF